MEYVYKFWKGNEVIYVGITNNMKSRIQSHISSYEWASTESKITYCKMPSRKVSKIYETYLINTLSPQYNKAENDADDMSLLSFDDSSIKWKEYSFINDKKSTQQAKNTKQTTKQKKKEKKKKNLPTIDYFYDFISRNKNNNVKLFYDKYRGLNISIRVVVSSEEVDMLFSSARNAAPKSSWNTLSAIKFRIDTTGQPKVTIHFVSTIEDKVEFKPFIKKLFSLLDADINQLDKNEGVKKDQQRIQEINEYFDDCLTQRRPLTILNMVNEKKSSIPVKELINGLEKIYNDGGGSYVLFYKRKKRNLYYQTLEEADGLTSPLSTQERKEWMTRYYWFKKENDGFAMTFSSKTQYHYLWFLIHKFEIPFTTDEDEVASPYWRKNDFGGWTLVELKKLDAVKETTIRIE